MARLLFNHNFDQSWTPSSTAPAPGTGTGGVVRRQRAVAHELERDDVRRLEDDVPLRDGLEPRGLGWGELGGERGDEVVEVGRGPHGHFDVAEILGVRVVWGRVVVPVREHHQSANTDIVDRVS